VKRFRFPLQPLLELREREERKLHGLFARAARDHARERESLAMLAAERARIAGDVCAGTRGPEPRVTREALVCLDLLETASARRGATARRSQEREAALGAAFADARRARRQLSALRERAHAAFVRAAEASEARALDEANAAHHNSAPR
jgi:flagellar export protein FliJ